MSEASDIRYIPIHEPCDALPERRWQNSGLPKPVDGTTLALHHASEENEKTDDPLTHHSRTMAAYNTIANERLYETCARLPDAERKKPREAFFGSIHGTLNHLLVGDRIWLARFADHPRPEGGLATSARLVTDAAAWAEARRAVDAGWLAWAEGLRPGDLDGDLTWVSGVTGGPVTRPRGFVATHVFNHQTHHRGQVHAMLTAAGLRPRDTDLFLMPL